MPVIAPDASSSRFMLNPPTPGTVALIIGIFPRPAATALSPLILYVISVSPISLAYASRLPKLILYSILGFFIFNATSAVSPLPRFTFFNTLSDLLICLTARGTALSFEFLSADSSM